MHCVLKFMALVQSFCFLLVGKRTHVASGQKEQPNAEVKCYPLDQCRGWMCQISHTLREANFCETVENLVFVSSTIYE